MHSLETIQRLNLEAAERELSREYGRALVVRDVRPWRKVATPDVWGALHERTRSLRTRLLALFAGIVAGCAHDGGPSVPDIAGPCPQSPGDPGSFQVLGVTRTLDGHPLLILRRNGH